MKCVQDSAVLGAQNANMPLLVPVCVGGHPSTFFHAFSKAVHHRLEEVTQRDLEPNF